MEYFLDLTVSASGPCLGDNELNAALPKKELSCGLHKVGSPGGSLASSSVFCADLAWAGKQAGPDPVGALEEGGVGRAVGGGALRATRTLPPAAAIFLYSTQ